MDINIDNLTYKQLREIALFTNPPLPVPYLDKVNSKESPRDSHPFKVGKNYLVRTVTMILIGRLEAVHDTEFVLSSASWIADTGRFYDALKVGSLDEVEPFTDDVIVGRGSLVDATIWTNALPKEQK